MVTEPYMEGNMEDLAYGSATGRIARFFARNLHTRIPARVLGRTFGVNFGFYAKEINRSNGPVTIRSATSQRKGKGVLEYWAIPRRETSQG
jgi:hypothetical protein